MDPAYFFGSLGLQEAADYLEGAQKRERETWEQTRHLSKVIVKCMTGSDFQMTMPWELPTAEEIEEQTEEAMAAAKAMERLVADGVINIEKGNVKKQKQNEKEQNCGVRF